MAPIFWIICFALLSALVFCFVIFGKKAIKSKPVAKFAVFALIGAGAIVLLGLIMSVVK